jgi:arylsulfatase A-like enzyme
LADAAANYWQPRTLTRENDPVDMDALPEDFFLTDAISDQAVEYIDEHAGRSEPCFLYTAYTAPHWPLHAHEEDIARYQGRFDAGWDQLREERLSRMRDLGLLDRSWPLTPRDSSQPPWEDADDKAWQARRMEVYAAQIDRMDQGIGRILDALGRNGQMDNTLIIFLADNGACAEEIDFVRWMQTRPFLSGTKHTRDGTPVRFNNDPKVMPGAEDTYQSYGVPWANLSNTPFREYKHWVHEGGIATPFIVHWPDRVEARGELRHQPGQLTDVMATCLDAAGAEYPGQFQGNEIKPLEGTSLTPIFDNRPNGKDALVWEHEGNRAVRKDDWKLVCKYPGDWELYNIVENRTETEDVAASHPEIVTELSAIYDAWAERCEVRPWSEMLAVIRARNRR